MDIEKNVKDVVNTGLGALGAAKVTLEENRTKVESYVTETETKVKDYIKELELKGATDSSEFATGVRDSIKEAFKQIADYQTQVEEFAGTNYAKLQLELAKYDIKLPSLDEAKAQVAELQTKLEETVAEAKTKVEGFVNGLNKEEKAEVAA